MRLGFALGVALIVFGVGWCFIYRNYSYDHEEQIVGLVVATVGAALTALTYRRR